MPHVVVRPGQEFVAEWSTGHGGYVYLTVVRSEDEDKLGTGDFGRFMHEDYLREAENDGVPSLIKRLGLMAHHGKEIPGILKNPPIFRNQTRWGHRPGRPQFSMHGDFSEFREYEPKFMEKIMGVERRKIKRYAYKSKKYPHLVQVHRFSIVYHRPLDVDVASMAIDEPGDYVVQNTWNGYYDCMDVRVLPPQKKDTPFPYGQINHVIQGKLVRIDHCQFVDQSNSDFCSEAFPDPNHCLSACDRTMKGHSRNGRFYSEATSGCFGVNIVPYKLMREARLSGSSLNLPAACNYLLKPANPFNLKDDAMICYGVKPRLKTSTQMEYEVSLDPRSGIFYSTCYQRRQAVEFAGNDDPGFRPSKQFLFGDKCISCNNAATNMEAGVPATDMVRGNVTVLPGALTPTWKLADECHDCEETPGKVDPSPHEVARKIWGTGHKDVTCMGLDIDADLGKSTGRVNSSSCKHANCVKFMTTPGKKATHTGFPVAFNLDHCKALAARDNECNDSLVYFRNLYSVERLVPHNHFHARNRGFDFKEGHICACIKKTSCCSGCQPRLVDHWSGSRDGPYLYSRTPKLFFSFNGYCEQKGGMPNGQKVGPESHPPGLGAEACKAECQKIPNCTRAVYDTRGSGTCRTDKLEAAPDQCKRWHQYWTYWKEAPGPKSQESLIQVSKDDTLTITHSMEDDPSQQDEQIERYPSSADEKEKDDEDLDDEHHDDDLACDGAQIPEFTQFAVDYLLEIGQDLANVSLLLPGVNPNTVRWAS